MDNNITNINPPNNLAISVSFIIIQRYKLYYCRPNKIDKNKEYNLLNKKDYYFIVLNKTSSNDIIINSVKGLSLLRPNINNLPFQVCWNKNRSFYYQHISKKIKLFIECLQQPKPSWKETFMTNIRTLK